MTGDSVSLSGYNSNGQQMLEHNSLDLRFCLFFGWNSDKSSEAEIADLILSNECVKLVSFILAWNQWKKIPDVGGNSEVWNQAGAEYLQDSFRNWISSFQTKQTLWQWRSSYRLSDLTF